MSGGEAPPRVFVARRIPDAGLAPILDACRADGWEAELPRPRDELSFEPCAAAAGAPQGQDLVNDAGTATALMEGTPDPVEVKERREIAPLGVTVVSPGEAA